MLMPPSTYVVAVIDTRHNICIAQTLVELASLVSNVSLVTMIPGGLVKRKIQGSIAQQGHAMPAFIHFIVLGGLALLMLERLPPPDINHRPSAYVSV
jgi:hypothetical protein